MEEGKALPRVMVDANILIAGIAFPRWSHGILRHALRGDIRLVLCKIVSGTVGQTRRRNPRRNPSCRAFAR